MKNKIGSVAWQEEMIENIRQKLANKEPLEDYQKAFIKVQTEFWRKLNNATNNSRN